MDALSAGAISLAAFYFATPYKVSFLPSGAKEAILVDGGIPTALMGSKGLFVAMIVRDSLYRDLQMVYSKRHYH